MTLGNKRAALVAWITAFAALGATAPVSAQPYSGNDSDEIRQTVARLSFVSGDVSFARGDAPDEWQLADPNVPMTLGDRAWTAAGRLELQVHGGQVVRLGSDTDLTVLNLTEETKQLSLSAGTGSFEIPRLGADEVFEVDTPNAAITFERPGNYRIDVNANGDSRLQVRHGRALVASAGGQVPLGAGEEIRIEGIEAPRYDIVAIARPDDWDRWVEQREARYANARSYQYVSRDIAGADDLDQYGRWQQVPSYGWCWTPLSAPLGWAPYRVGRWVWQDPWGWTWVSSEPWGWAPYHYGRWVVWSSRWYWVPVAPRVAVVTYSPALVAFVGGGPGFSASVGLTTDYVGWFPLAPRDPLIPWWGRPPTVSVTHVTYVNRTYVTVVNQTTFVSSRTVTTNIVRDRTIVTRVERAPVVRGAIPVIPTQASIRVATRSVPAPRPPSAAVSRAVVTRMAPPPAPPRFEAKQAVIRENRGRPVSATEAHRMVSRESGQPPAPARPVRPAAEPGRMTLAPANDNVRGPRPEPVAPARGRPLATNSEPVAVPPEAKAPAAERSGRPAPTRNPRNETRSEPSPAPRAEPRAAENPPRSPEAARQAQAERERAAARAAETQKAERERAQAEARREAQRTEQERARPTAARQPAPQPPQPQRNARPESAPAPNTVHSQQRPPERPQSEPRPPAARHPTPAPPPARGHEAPHQAPQSRRTVKPEKTPRQSGG